MPICIDAEKLEKDGWWASRAYQQNTRTNVYETKKLTDFPTVNVPERNVGRWEERKTFYTEDENPISEWQSARCSVCGRYHTSPYLYYFHNYNFCPNCGAKMTAE